MKKYINIICAICVICATLTSCEDFFSPETDDEFDANAGYSSNTEMYTGFLGIITKVQAIGDKEILLTETRGELIEPSDESSSELISLYNYDANLQGNTYANPMGYYEVIIACNDYLNSMLRYREHPNVDDDAWQTLVSSAVRIKVWTYKTLAEIYGEAIWFDDPMTELVDIHDERFELLQLPQLIDRCLTLLEQGYEGVKSNLNIDWHEYLAPGTSLANSEYRKWNWMIPAYAGLYAELCLWKGAVMDAQGQDALAYYQNAADTLLIALGGQINVTSDPGSNVYWLPSAATPGHYNCWDLAQPYPYETVSAIFYDYTKNQTNTLLKHFSNEYPNKYWLRPSEAGMERFLDPQFNPGSSTNDTRYKRCFGTSAGQPYLSKFRSVGSSARVNAYQDDCHIYFYRATQYHMMLCEALNHLRRFYAMNAVFNSGVSSTGDHAFEAGKPEWAGFESTIDPTKSDWTGDANFGTRRYPSMGIRGCFGTLVARPVKTDIFELGEQGTYRFNDLALLDESMLEFAGEGKVYPMMNRMAVRYNDPSIVADRICPKYTDAGLASTVRSRIMDGGYWVKYDLYNE